MTSTHKAVIIVPGDGRELENLKTRFMQIKRVVHITEMINN